jgi:hypothetical protein
MTQKISRKYLNTIVHYHTFLPEIYIETGAREGNNLLKASELRVSPLANCAFREIESVELNDYYFSLAVERCKEISHINIVHGDSAVELPKILKKYNEPVVVFLDAHYYDDPNLTKSRFPLWDELTAMKNRDYEDIIIVDDIRVFGIERYDLGTDWVNVTFESLTNFFEGKLKFSGPIGDTFVMSKIKP